MAKFTEEQLNGYRMPPSATEEQKLANAENQIRQAISLSTVLKNKNYKIFGQGSYANDTNVKNNSDVDINVRLDDTVFVQLPENKTDADYGYSNSAYTYLNYRTDVLNAMIDYFGHSFVVDNNKCITILENSYRVEIDVVPTLKFIRYDSDTIKVEGVKFLTSAGIPIINYPLQHIENGKSKNASTQKRFKRLTRIYRKVRYKMIEDNISVSPNVTSFLLECLVWNVPDRIFNDNHSWTERLKKSIEFLYNNTKSDDNCHDWGEVSELLYLFRGRKWSVSDVHNYLLQMWQYLQY